MYVILCLFAFLVFMVLYSLFEAVRDHDYNYEHYDNADDQSFDLTHIDSLTFNKNAMTDYRRTSAIPQLSCIGGDACHYSDKINVVQCNNQGKNDMGDIQWKCESPLDKKVRFGKTNVSCEGYANSKDKLKLKNSCGLRYELYLNKPDQPDSTSVHIVQEKTSYAYYFLIFIIFFVLFIVILNTPHSGTVYRTNYYDSYYADGSPD